MSGCWIWTGIREDRPPKTRPIFSVYKAGSSARYVGARIHAFKALVGEPLGTKTRATCGLSDCVNPAHARFKIKNQRLHKRDHHRLKTYGVSSLHYKQMLHEQRGCCAVCAKPLIENDRRGVHVDHNHATGVVRALLCGHCNRGLGHFFDKPSILRAAIAYLIKHGTPEDS